MNTTIHVQHAQTPASVSPTTSPANIARLLQEQAPANSAISPANIARLLQEQAPTHSATSPATIALPLQELAPTHSATSPANIVRLLQELALARPGAPAIIERHGSRDRITSFGELQQQVTQAVALLDKSGLRPGDKVLVFQPMSLELYVSLIALFRLGLVAMFLDPSAGREHIEQCCALIPPQALIASPKAYLLRLLSPALRRIPRTFVIGAHLPGAISWTSAQRLEPQTEIYPAGPETPALLTFTSGSTGQPKAALRTHGFLLAQHRVLERASQWQDGEMSLTTMPIFVLANLAAGVTSLIAAGNLRKPGSIDPGPIIEQIERYRPTRAEAAPSFWERISAACQQQQRQLTSLRVVYAGGAPVFPRVLAGLQEIAPQADIVAVYGSTEAEPIAHIAYHEIHPTDLAAMQEGQGLLAGPPAPDLQVRILPAQWGTPLAPWTAQDFHTACLTNREPGEIVVSGEHVLSGYLYGHGDEETKFRVDDSIWHRTGDLGYFDEQGRLWLLGRCTARIQDERGTLYPFTVETAISSYPAIRRSAAISARGQRILVLEFNPHSPHPNPTHLAQNIAWADFAAVQIYKHIPVDKRHNAKIDYPALTNLLTRTTSHRQYPV